MASSFGVELKKADGSKSNKNEGLRTPGGARRSDFKSKPVSDLKAMFDKKDGDASGATVATTSTTSEVKTQVTKKDITSSSKFGITAKTTTETSISTKLSKQNSGGGISNDDRAAFAALKNKLDKTGINDLIVEQPKVAVAKTYSGGTTYQATVGAKKVQSADSSSGPVSKGDAASFLSFGLTKLRTRPNCAKLDEEKFEDGTKRPSSPSSPRPGSPKYLPGAAKGWKGSSGLSDSGTGTSKNGKFPGSSLEKVKDQVKSEPKIAFKGFRSVSPVSVNSDDSSSSSNLSPRGYKPLGKLKVDDPDKKTDVNENIKKFEKPTADPNVFNKVKKDNQSKVVNSALDPRRRTDTKPKLSAVEQLNLIKEKNKVNRNSRSASSDSDKGKMSPRFKGENKVTEKSRISLEDLRQEEKTKGDTRRPLSRASSSGSNSSLSLSDSRGIKTQTDRIGSPVGRNISESKLGIELRRKEFAVSKRMSTDKFQDIKKGFETKGDNVRTQSPPAERKPKLDIKPSSRILERKQSFEGGEIFRRKSSEKKEITLPKHSGHVLKHIQALHELDAKAKAQPALVRRTRSLPSTSDPVGDDSSDCFYEDIEGYYHDAISTRAIDDISNEGDISSEADLYEVIPAHKTLEKNDAKKDHNQRRATAFRKRRKTSDELAKSGEPQPGTDGDIDSDTDSSNSGVYEQLDRDDEEVEAVSESDDVKDGAPEPPPTKSINNKKKNKKAGDKATKGFKGRIKQLYNKGKGAEADGGGKGTNGTGQQSSRLMSSLGDKLKKNLKKNKYNSAPNLEEFSIEDNPVCDSEGTDTDFDQDLNTKMSNQEEGSGDGQAPVPPPLPPRQSGLLRASSGGDLKLQNSMELPARSSTSNLEVPDNRKSSATQDTKSDPPLPPRNRISNNLDLNVVIPVKPGGDGRKAGKDSYLHGQKMNNAAKSPDDIPYMDMCSPPGTTSPDSGPPIPQRPSPTYKKLPVSSTSSNDSYVDVGDTIVPPVPQRPASRAPLGSQSSYVDVGDAPIPDTNYSLADEIRRDNPGRKELEKRPESSAYIKSSDLSTVPEPRNMKTPVSDVLSLCNQYEEDGLYIDLSDDQVYGTMGRRYKSQLESESLYQVYNKEKVCRASKRKAIYSSFDESDEEGYYDDGGDKDSVYEDLSAYSSGRGSMDLDKKQEEEKSNKLSTLELFGKKGTVLRALWSEMPEVKSSGVLETITPHERKLQESMFEIITSEATYLKSLNVLMDVFLMSEEFGSDLSNKCVITKQERHVIFSNIGAIRDTSERFLSALESRWKESVVLSDVCDIIASHASKYFECYVNYCSNQTFQDRAVTDLRKKHEFNEALRQLESHPDCQGLPMISFLLLPMQRITRLPLLVDAICHRMDPIKDKARHKSAVNAFSAMSKVVKKCNNGAKKMQQTEQMYHIARQIDFTYKEIASIPLISASRCLVKQGEVTRIANDAASRLPFGKAKAGKQAVNLYLFNDLLLITKKKGDRFVVTDYGQRNALHVETIDCPEKNARVLPLGVPSGCKNLFLLVMLENHEKKQVETVFACNTTSDRARWVDAVTPVKVTDDDQRIYEEWDCPQVQCIKHYNAQEPDELSLEESDVVNVFKKIEDGMWEGERLRDGERGWFPKDHTVEIVNSHVRARNLRMKYRLMATAGQ